MSIERVFVASALQAEGIDAEYFASILSYVDGAVAGLAWDDRHEAFRVRFAGTEAALDELVAAIRARISPRLAAREPRVLKARRGAAPPADVWPELVRRGDCLDFGDGHVGYSGEFLTLIEELDLALCGIARSLGARPVHLPRMLSRSTMARLGVFDHYPHHVYFAATLTADVAGIESFQRLDPSTNHGLLEHVAPPEWALKTSSCSPLYPSLDGRDLPGDELFTTVGECTRNEARNATRLERLTEFRMREIVFVGDTDGAERFRRLSLDLAWELCCAFDLSARLVTARDSFFLSQYSEYATMQLLSGDKIEARARLGAHEGEIAVASFNRHHNYFSRRFAIRVRGVEAATACIGFGLERLAYAALCQGGLDGGVVRDRLRRLCEQRTVQP